MLEDFEEAIVKAIARECHAAGTFLALAQFTEDPDLMHAFIGYAQEELKHAMSLVAYMKKELGVERIPLELEPLEPIENLHVSMIEYLAEEESSIFFYESLARLASDDHSRRLFEAIRDEEQSHMECLQGIIDKGDESL